ncbi:hypothetical protein [Microcoleus asticus]|uniref:DUF4435 domain-containing protein n=1 Tax=Microcoleus asticus IPMA8 TaxID=2563858 RepID=A0ABX2D763_9CYAN|nr:hypothetical protein [Microcoleus asticus]NQE38504.1 hypothetical protein [Microcoleus asticus IPMA8]
MSVVSSGKIIFCEGKPSSLDYRLLTRVVDSLPGDRCTIVPAGSKFGFSTFAEGYFSGKTAVNQKYIVFRDRDFDVQPTPNCGLLQLDNRSGNKPFDLSYRTCVENYLLDADLIHTYWTEKYNEKQGNPASKWGHQNSPEVDRISESIETSARNLQDYQAVRWALGDLVNMSTARQQLKTTWTEKGKLPESLILQDCKNQALELVNQFRLAVESVTPEKFEDNLVSYQQRFNQEEFWTEKQYLIWFNGKDIQKEIQRQDSKYISLNSFFDWAIRKLEINQHPDLIELRTKIEQL